MTLPAERAFDYTTHHAKPITPELAAKWVADMDSEEQARFFNQLTLHMESWEHPYRFQLSYIANCLTPEAKQLWQTLGDYATGDPQ